MNRFFLPSLFASFLALLGWGAQQGNFVAESSQIMQMTWGLIMLIDLYIGLFIFSAFIYLIEKSVLKTFAWSCALMVGGNLISILYLIARNKAVAKAFREKPL